jgi:carbonic anhydrase
VTIEKIISGFMQFRREVLPELSGLFQRLANEQNPTVLLVGCSDSRLVPARLVSINPGEVFEVRSVGNFVTPSGARGVSSGDVGEAAAIEFAVGVLGVRDILILGHSSCGAMSALLANADLKNAPNLKEWLSYGRPALYRQQELTYDESLSPADKLSQANVVVQIDNCATYPLVREAIDAGRLWLHGAWLDVGSGDLHLLDRQAGKFKLLDEDEAARRLGDGPNSIRASTPPPGEIKPAR